MRNLLGLGAAAVHWRRGRAPLSTGAAAGPRYPLALRPGPVIHWHCGPALRRSPYLWGLCSLWAPLLFGTAVDPA